MKGKKINEYTSANGNVVSVFELTGKSADLSAYEAHQSENFVRDENTGKALFFATKQASGIYEGDVVDIIFAEKLDSYIIDKSAERKVNQLLEAHAGTPLGDAIANAEAERLLSRARGGQTPAQTSAPAPAETPQESADDSAE